MPPRSPITTHVLDTSKGTGAAGISARLSKWIGVDQWNEIRDSVTTADGRIENLLPAGERPELGIYRLVFDTQEYYRTQGGKCFYPSVTIVFEVTHPDEHYHIPLLLSPYGYSTYRGS